MKWFALFLCFVISLSSWSFKLSPMSQSLIPGEGQKHILFTVQNQSSEPIAVELSMAKRDMNELGKEKHPEVEDQFIIFPDQMIIKAGKKRTVKVTYLGKKNVNVEKAYRLIAEQLPIDVANKDKKKRGNIRILLKYVAAVYVTPQKGNSKPELISDKGIVKDGHVNVSVINKGSLHHILNKHYLKISSGRRAVTLKEKELVGMFGENVLAGGKRKFRIKLPKILKSAKTLKLELVSIDK